MGVRQARDEGHGAVGPLDRAGLRAGRARGADAVAKGGGKVEIAPTACWASGRDGRVPGPGRRAVRRRARQEWRSGRLPRRPERVMWSTCGRPTWPAPRSSTAASWATRWCRSRRKDCATVRHLVSGGFVRAGVMQKHDERRDPDVACRTCASPMRRPPSTRPAHRGKVIREPVTLGRVIVAIVAGSDRRTGRHRPVARPGGPAVNAHSLRNAARGRARVRRRSACWWGCPVARATGTAAAASRPASATATAATNGPITATATTTTRTRPSSSTGRTSVPTGPTRASVRPRCRPMWAVRPRGHRRHRHDPPPAADPRAAHRSPAPRPMPRGGRGR